MNQVKPLFTIIIPTKDRATYLADTIRTCINQNYNNLEIIISDDASIDNTKELCEQFEKSDNRIKYIRRDVPLGMRMNFEKTLELVKPGFVLALGGDDGLMPYAIEEMWSILKNTNLQLLTWEPPTFVYPDSYNKSGQLMLSLKKISLNNGVKIIQSSDFLKRQARNLAYASDIECPMFYVKGVASTDLVKKIINKTPEKIFYSCPTPDGYSGIILAGEVQCFAFSQNPLSIFGLSKNSQGKNYLSNNESAKNMSESFYRTVAEIPMHRQLASQPYSPLISLMTADYLLRAKDLHSDNTSYPELDFRNVIEKSIEELRHGLYAHERLERELNILSKIAEMHNLKAYFNDLIIKTRRYKKKEPLKGNAISPKTLFIEASTFGINNIFDASYIAYFHYKTKNQFSLSIIFKAIFNSFFYLFKSKKRGENFPLIAK
jgi:glycosyltransferase involved in cell wall biosynthesis